MLKRILLCATLLATAALSLTLNASTNDLVKGSNVTVHEWGTFTSVAGVDGKAAQWLPLAGPNDLPCFVEFFSNKQATVRSKVLLPASGPRITSTPPQPLEYSAARTQLLGSIRMETPVLYFYSPETAQLKVRVAFPQGFVTEWYPQAAVNQTVVAANALENANTGATIVWKDVTVLPANSKVNLPQGKSGSHYYAARDTDANPIRVNRQDEKFLFYRGVGGFPVPLNVTVTEEGKIHIQHLAGKPSVILFESHGGKLGFRLVDTSKNEALLDPPVLNGTFAELRSELKSALVDQGLYPREAEAMLETWKDSWFEEGTRVIYIVPPAMVDAILPLTIEPRPLKVSRVFVGRVEVITPETLRAVQTAIDANDPSIVPLYGRFLGPIAERLPQTQRLTVLLDSAFQDFIRGASSCRE